MAWPRLNQRPRRGLIAERPAGATIPRVIHQTFHAPPWPVAYERAVAQVRATNPGWEHRFHDYPAREAFIAEAYGPAVLRQYLRINPDYGAARADLFRYLLLYHEGGVYLDMKSATARPLDEGLRADDRYLLSPWRTGGEDRFQGWGRHPEVSHLPHGEFQQWFIAAAPGHPFLLAVIELVLGNIERYMHGLHSHGAYAVLRVTGPVPYTLAIAPLLGRFPHRIVDSAADLGLVYSLADGDAARSHAQTPGHYTRLSTPLVRMDAPHALASGVFAAGKAVAKAVRRG